MLCLKRHYRDNPWRHLLSHLLPISVSRSFWHSPQCPVVVITVHFLFSVSETKFFFICKYYLINGPMFLMFLSSLVCSQHSFHLNVLTHACLIKQDLSNMSFFLSLALHRGLSEILGNATWVGFKHDVVLSYLWRIIIPKFLLTLGSHTVLKPHSVFFLCMCAYVGWQWNSDTCPALPPYTFS